MALRRDEKGPRGTRGSRRRLNSAQGGRKIYFLTDNGSGGFVGVRVNDEVSAVREALR